MVTVELHETLSTSVLLQFMIPLLVVIGWIVWSETSWKNPTVLVTNCGLKSAFLLAFTVISHCTTAKSRAVCSRAPLACKRSCHTPNPHFFFSLVPSFLLKLMEKVPTEVVGLVALRDPLSTDTAMAGRLTLGWERRAEELWLWKWEILACKRDHSWMTNW